MRGGFDGLATREKKNSPRPLVQGEYMYQYSPIKVATMLNLIPRNILIVLSYEPYLNVFATTKKKKKILYTFQTKISGYFNVLKFCREN